jgi:hypothetical protein
MEYKYFIDFLGTLVFLFAHVFTYANPYVMGIVTFAVYMIGSPMDAVYFSPLPVSVSYFLGKMSTEDAIYAVLSQYVAVVLIILTFKPLKVFMDLT